MYDGPYPGGPFGPFGGLLDGPLAPLLLVGVLVYLAVRITRGSGSSTSGGAREAPGGAGASLLEALSVLAVGVLIAFFVGSGIQAFYPAPEPPQLLEEGPEEPLPPDDIDKKGPPPEAKTRFKQEMETFQDEIPRYNRVASPIAVGIGVLILAAVLPLRRIRIPAIRDGVALGGVLTLFYGLVLAFQAEGDVLRFLMVAVVLLVVLVAVYLRFRPERTGRRSVG